MTKSDERIINALKEEGATISNRKFYLVKNLPERTGLSRTTIQKRYPILIEENKLYVGAGKKGRFNLCGFSYNDLNLEKSKSTFIPQIDIETGKLLDPDLEKLISQYEKK